jgi:hypothetical protein
MTLEEMKARLLAEAERAIDEMLAEKPAADQIRLDEIEALAVRSGQHMQAGVLRELAQEGQAAPGAVEQVCERCGSRMQRQVMTEAGAVTVDRPYYVCPGCGAGFFPPG